MLEVAKPATIAITKRIIGAAAAAAIGAAVWAFLDGGAYPQRFGWLLAIIGGVMAIPTRGGMSRADTDEAHGWLGWGPEKPDQDLDVGGVGLTRIGVLLFVSIPLFATGLLLA
jgi:hypothetical protein